MVDQTALDQGSALDEANRRRLQARRDALGTQVGYAPGPHGGDVLLLHCTETSEAVADGWRALVRGELTVVRLPGGHGDMFDEPALSVVVATLETHLTR